MDEGGSSGLTALDPAQDEPGPERSAPIRRQKTTDGSRGGKEMP